MGSIKKQYLALQKQLQGIIDQARQPSPWETELSNEYNKNKSFLDSKDYRNVPGGIDMLPLSDYKRMSSYGQAPAGQTAFGGGNEMALQQQRDLDNNILTRDWAHAYEGKVGDLRNRNTAMIGGLQDMYSNRMQTGIQGYGSLLDSQARLKQLYPQSFGAQLGWMLAGTGANALTSLL